MPITSKIEDALNGQMHAEFTASFLYLSLAAYYSSLNLGGFAAYMKAQSAEEREHAMSLYEMLDARGGRIRLSQIESPPIEWASPLAGIEDMAKWEALNSERINAVIKTAHDENDFATVLSLKELVTEQVEDEATAAEILEKMKMLEKAPGGLFIMDRELRFRAQKG